jgi:hypothetical protein
MDLIPIPQEEIAQTLSSTKTKIIQQIRGNLKQKADSRDTKIFHKTCLKMSQYMVDAGQFNANKVDGLIDNMHRCILTLQKRKRKLIRYKKKKK